MAIEINMQSITINGSVVAPSVTITILNSFLQDVYDDDLHNVFFEQTDFGEPIRWYHSSLNTWENYIGIFDDPKAKINVGSQADFNSLRPQIQIIQSSLKHKILKQDKFKIRNKTYIVDDVIEDGVGVITAFGNITQ